MSNEQDGVKTGARQFRIEVDGKAWEFLVGKSAFDRFMREAQADANRAANNLLLNSSTERDKLKAAFDEHWDLPMQMMSVLSEEMLPVREVSLKKS